MNEHKGWARNGEVEDFMSPKEIDFFPDSKAIVIINGPLGPESVTMTGPTTVEVDLGQMMDSDQNGLEEVPTVMTQLTLTGTSQKYGVLSLVISPTIPSTGVIEEKVNNIQGVLELPPFTQFGGANSFFDIFIEVVTPVGTLHNIVPKHMETMIFHKPPKDAVYQSPEEIILYTESEVATSFSIGLTLHAPDPDETVVVCVKLFNGDYYPCTQFFIGDHGVCGEAHYHSIFGFVYSILLVTTPDPDPTECGFGKVSELPDGSIQMTNEQVANFEETTGIPIT